MLQCLCSVIRFNADQCAGLSYLWFLHTEVYNAHLPQLLVLLSFSLGPHFVVTPKVIDTMVLCWLTNIRFNNILLGNKYKSCWLHTQLLHIHVMVFIIYLINHCYLFIFFLFFHRWLSVQLIWLMYLQHPCFSKHQPRYYWIELSICIIL